MSFTPAAPAAAAAVVGVDFTTPTPSPPPSPRSLDKPDPQKWGRNSGFRDPAACFAPLKGPEQNPPTPDEENR